METLHANIDFSRFSEKIFEGNCLLVKNQLTTNAADYPGLVVTMAIFGGHLNTYSGILGSAIYASKAGDLLAARTVLEQDVRLNGVYVNSVAKGVLTMLQKSGYPISKEHAPIGPLAQAGFKS